MATATHYKTIVGVFNSVYDAQEAVRELESTGISRDDISMVANKNAVGYETMDKADRDKTADVVADAGIGAAIGGVGGLLLSAAGALTVPVVGPVLAAGPIAAALTGAGIGAAAGGLIGALTESGVPEEDAKYYAEGVRRGDVLVTVRVDESRVSRVADILDRHDAIDVDERVQSWRSRGWSGYSETAQPYTEDELRQERRYYGGGLGQSGDIMGARRERERTESPTRETNYAGDVGTSGRVSTTGLTASGLGPEGRVAGAGHSSPEVTGDDRSITEKAGDKLRDLRDEARENKARMDAAEREEAERRRRARVYDRY